MGENTRQLSDTNCPRCGTTQVYSDGKEVFCMCCHGRWTTKEKFDQEVEG